MSAVVATLPAVRRGGGGKVAGTVVAGDAGATTVQQTHAIEVQPGAAWAPLPGGYRRRDVEATVLHQVVRENLATFLEEAQEHGGLPGHVEKELFDYLGCGVLANGFSRVRCQACGDELLVAFSCKRRGVCPSCNSRRAHDTSLTTLGTSRPPRFERLHLPWISTLPHDICWFLYGKLPAHRLRRSGAGD
jgi:hypothetical protein